MVLDANVSQIDWDVDVEVEMKVYVASLVCINVTQCGVVEVLGSSLPLCFLPLMTSIFKRSE